MINNITTEKSSSPRDLSTQNATTISGAIETIQIANQMTTTTWTYDPLSKSYINGKKIYVVSEKILGEGKDGIVYELTSTDCKSKAIKFSKMSALKPEGDSVFAEYQNAIKVVDEVKQNGIQKRPKCLFYNNDAEPVRMVMPKYEGNLATFLSDENISWEEGKRAILQLTEGLAYLHKKGFVHRDINQKNIFYFRKNGEAFFDISDFGHISHSTTAWNRSVDISGLKLIFKEIVAVLKNNGRDLFSKKFHQFLKDLDRGKFKSGDQLLTTLSSLPEYKK